MPKSYDCIVIGGGHNGLIAASYLGKAGLKTLLLERRHVLGGCSVTEEIYPGFKFSVASYIVSLLRPEVIRDLELLNTSLVKYRPTAAYGHFGRESASGSTFTWERLDRVDALQSASGI